VKALAALPSLDELRGKIVGLLVAPATKIAQLTTRAPRPRLARRGSGLCLKERSGLTPFAKRKTWFEPIRLRKQING